MNIEEVVLDKDEFASSHTVHSPSVFKKRYESEHLKL